MADPINSAIREHFGRLYSAWGPQNWWPAQSRLEVMVGAILTQNTSWTNVEKALQNLRAAGVLNLAGIRDLPVPGLETLLRPSGYFRQKSARLKTLIAFLDQQFGGSLDRMFATPTGTLRELLLGLNGIGPETADSILLYAGNHEVFVVDAYTRRIVGRHGILPPEMGYEQIRAAFESALAEEQTVSSIADSPRHSPSRISRSRRSPVAERFNQMHALMVRAGNQHCRTQPACHGCPLEPLLAACAIPIAVGRIKK